MPPAAIGAAVVGGAVVGGVFNYLGQKKQAEATQAAAEAQLGAAKDTREVALEYATPTTQELMLLDKQIAYSEQAIARQQKLLDAVDPALIESGKQALQLLRGEDARAIAPVRNQRDDQRKQLVADLTRQFGPGAETSSAGVNALRKFDNETATVLADVQMKTLGQLLGTSAAVRPNVNADLSLTSQPLSTISAIRSRQASAVNATPITPYAGAPFVGAALSGSTTSNIGTNISQTGTTLGTLALLQNNKTS